MDLVTIPILTKVLTATAADTSYTAPDATRTQFSACTVTNIDAASHNFTATITPNGGAAVDILYQKAVSAGKSVVVAELIGQVLGPGDKIEFAADAPAFLNLALSGYEET